MPLSAYWRLIRGNRNVRLLWMAQVVSELGDWFYSVAIFSFLLDLTGSARLVSLAFLAQVLPQTLFAPAAGLINDRLSRRKVMMFADWSRALIVLSMVLVRSRGTLWLLFVLLFSETICYGLFEPGARAIIPNIAKPGEIAAANALNSATWSVIFGVGAALGGVVAVAFGRNTVFVLNSLSFVASALLLRRMRFAEPHAENQLPLRSRDLLDFSGVAEGVRYVRRDSRLIAAIFVKSGCGLMGANWVILPLLGEKVFPLHLAQLTDSQAGTLGMSALLGSRGVGAMLGSILGGNVAGSDPARLRRTILAAFLMAAGGYLFLGAAGVACHRPDHADRRALRRLGGVDLLDHAVAGADRRSFPRPRVLGRVCLLYVHAGRVQLRRWAARRRRRAGANPGLLDRRVDDRPGFGLARRPARLAQALAMCPATLPNGRGSEMLTLSRDR